MKFTELEIEINCNDDYITLFKDTKEIYNAKFKGSREITRLLIELFDNIPVLGDLESNTNVRLTVIDEDNRITKGEW